MEHLDHLIHDWIDSAGWPPSALIRLALAALCGALVGLEREVRGRQAGFRTNVLVCLGCAIVMLVSVQVGHLRWPDEAGPRIQVDPARIAYGVMAGVGFLGAGTIIKHGADVRGLTTAAGMWCVAGIGLAAGLGLYLFALAATLMVVAVLWGLEWVERFLPRTEFRAVTLRLPWSDGCVARVVDRVRAAGLKVGTWDMQRSADLASVDLTLNVGFYDRAALEAFERQLPLGDGCQLVSVCRS